MSSAFVVTVSRAGTFSLAVTADDNIADGVTVTQEGAWLRLALEGYPSTTNLHLTARVTLPDVEAVRIGGIAKVRLQGFDDLGHALVVDVDGVGRLTGHVSVDTLAVHLAGGGGVDMVGAGGTVNVVASGSGAADLGGFVCRRADVDLSGAVRVTVHPRSSLTGSLQNAAVLRYRGSPGTVKVVRTDAARLEHLD